MFDRWESKLTRQAYADALVELGNEDNRVVVFDADLAASTLTRQFAQAHPDRFFDMGIAEQGMVGTAAGLALMGFRPFITSYAMFVAGRGWELIRQQCSYGEAGVVIVGAHGGISVGKDGPTHQSTEDLALMRVLPNLSVVVPCDYWETFKVVKYAGRTRAPFYFRIGREPVPSLTKPDDPWELGRANTLAEGTDITLIACGLAVAIALEARDQLGQEGISARVLNMHTLKPLDRSAIAAAQHDTRAIVTIEEHSVIGGLGSAVAEVVAQSENPVPLRIVGVQDRFLESGPPEDLLEIAGLTARHVASTVRNLIEA